MGVRIGGDWLVESGLKAGERVITDGAQKLRPGAAIVPKPDTTAQARRDEAERWPASSSTARSSRP